MPSPGRLVSARDGDPNDALALLRENRDVEQGHGFDAIESRKVRSRRLRDYLLLLATGNILIVAVVVAPPANVVTVVFGLSRAILFSVELGSVMWQVVGRY